MFSNIKNSSDAQSTFYYLSEYLYFIFFSKFKILKSKIENFRIGGIVLNNFYF